MADSCSHVLADSGAMVVGTVLGALPVGTMAMALTARGVTCQRCRVKLHRAEALLVGCFG